MKKTSYLLIVILFVETLLHCSFQKKQTSCLNGKDTLRIRYSDTILVGKQVFPLVADTNSIKHLINERVLLTFESRDYYYVFFNKKEEIFFLSSTYWEKLIPKYLNSLDVDRSNSSKYIEVEYSDGPFLTGFYNLTDSIIVLTSELKRKELKNTKKLHLYYFSTYSTLLKLKEFVAIGSKIEEVIKKLQIPSPTNLLRKKKDFKVILMEATSFIDNAWYNRILPNCYSDYSITIVLSFSNDKLVQIKYLDIEYIGYIFKQKNVLTKDIHYQ